MTLRFALLALAISLSPVLLSAAVQYSAPVLQTVGTEPRLPRKKSFFPQRARSALPLSPAQERHGRRSAVRTHHHISRPSFVRFAALGLYQSGRYSGLGLGYFDFLYRRRSHRSHHRYAHPVAAVLVQRPAVSASRSGISASVSALPGEVIFGEAHATGGLPSCLFRAAGSLCRCGRRACRDARRRTVCHRLRVRG